jgi:hypothetical protein
MVCGHPIQYSHPVADAKRTFVAQDLAPGRIEPRCTEPDEHGIEGVLLCRTLEVRAYI